MAIIPGIFDLSNPSYPRPPIAEAIIELRFSEDIAKDRLFEGLKEALGEQYPGIPNRQNRVVISANMQGDEFSSSAESVPHVIFLKSADGKRLLGCVQSTLSIHVLPPYPGWISFLDQALEAIQVLPKFLQNANINSVAVRYIDRITLPIGAIQFSDYFTIIPPRPAGMPVMVHAFSYLTETVDPADNTTALLSLVSLPSDQSKNESGSTVIMDLLVQLSGSPLCCIADSKLQNLINSLHDRHHVIFEGSITDHTRSLFQ